jgi:hypothetical protein
VQAYERSKDMPRYGYELMDIQPPVNRRLEGTASWINMLQGIDRELPEGWVNVEDVAVVTPQVAEEVKSTWTVN